MMGDSYLGGIYDGYNFVERHQVVMVTLNYRLGFFGFAALDALKREDAAGSTGNYGIQDQRLALQWVQQNILAFGGDPKRVTIFGESAGAMSVMSHLVSPASKGLFAAAIMESGTSSVTYFFQPYRLASAFYQDWSERVGCPGSPGDEGQVLCLRRLPSEKFGITGLDITKFALERREGRHPALMPDVHSPLWPIMPVGPVIDGTPVGLLDVPINLVLRGTFNHVPLLVGANENGGSIFEPTIPLIVPGGEWPASRFPTSLNRSLEYFLGAKNTAQVLSVYSEQEFASASHIQDARLSRIIRDFLFQCSDRALARGWAQNGLASYLYVFRFQYGVLVDRLLNVRDCHGSELPFVFRNLLDAIKVIAPLSEPETMADIMSCKWASFAYTHEPNGGSNESSWPPNCADVNRRYSDWPRFELSQPLWYDLSVNPKIQRVLADNFYPDDLFPRDEKCDLWDQLSQIAPWVHETTKVGDTRSSVFI